MKRLIGLLLLTALFSVVAGCAVQDPQEARDNREVQPMQAADPSESGPSSVGATHAAAPLSGQVLVRFRDGIETGEIERIKNEAGLHTVKVVSAPQLYLMEITDGSPLEDMLVRLKAYPEIVYAEPNYPRATKRK